MTPNIDQLAKEGTLFERAYVQQPVYGIARKFFDRLTARHNWQSLFDPYCRKSLGDCPSLLRHFMNQGYYVRGLGKIHHGYHENFTEKSFMQVMARAMPIRL